jgi:Mce-associated membrane protein
VIEEHDPQLDEPATDDRPTSRPRLATTLAALCALVLVAGIVLMFWLRAQTEENADAEQDRIQVLQAAEQFTETFNTFRPDDAKDYVDRVSALLSTKFRTEFEDGSEDVITGITQQRLFSKGEVLSDGDGIPLVGIASIDVDSAEVLVVSDAKRVASGQRVLRHWRWQVSLVKVDGKWLVDDFKEV